MSSTMAQLFVHGHDLDFRTVFSRGESRTSATASAASRTGSKQVHRDGSLMMPASRRHARRPFTCGSTRQGGDETWAHW